MKVIYVLGKTCVGKSTLIEKALAYSDKIGACEVGKEFRRRYPPDHFKGLGAMQDTEKEALEILDMFFEKAKAENKEWILVDGQPRLVSSINKILWRHNPEDENVWWCYVPPEVAIKRAHGRFDTTTPVGRESAKLASDRLVNDAVQLYDVMWHMVCEQAIPILGVELIDGFDYDRFFRTYIDNVR